MTSRRRLTPIYADAPAPPRPAPRTRKPFRIAKMELPVLMLIYAVTCGYRLLGDNLVNGGLNPLHWTRARLHFGDALFQALWLTFVLLAFHFVLRLGKKRERTAR